jgi:hypothetical protein
MTDPNAPLVTGDANLLIWGIVFGVLTVAAIVLAYLNRQK